MAITVSVTGRYIQFVFLKIIVTNLLLFSVMTGDSQSDFTIPLEPLLRPSVNKILDNLMLNLYNFTVHLTPILISLNPAHLAENSFDYLN